MNREKHRLLVSVATYTLPVFALVLGASAAGHPIGVLVSIGEPLLLAMLLMLFYFH